MMGVLIPNTSGLLIWLIESTLTVSILICIIMSVRAALGRKLPAWWIHGLWVLLIIRMLVPVNFETSLSVFNLVPKVSTEVAYIPYLQENGFYMPFLQEISPENRGEEGFNSGQQELSAQVAAEPVAEAISPGRKLSLQNALLLVWFSGAVALALLITAKHFRFWWEIRKEPELADSQLLEIFAECKRMLGVRAEVPLIATNKVKSPAIFGYFKPRLLIPADVTQALQASDLSCVFLHELGHLKRHDIGVSWLAAAAQCLYWFNPLVWIAFHNMRSDQEAACDAFVLSRLEQVRPQNYASTIVNLLENYGMNRPVQALAGIVENKSQLKRRIKMIVNFRRRRPKETMLSAVALASMGVALFTNPLSVSAQTDLSDVFRFKYEEQRSFSLNLPDDWYSRPPGQPSEVVRFSSSEDDVHSLIVFQGKNHRSVEENVEGAQRSISASGGSDFVVSEGAVGPIRAIVLDFEKAASDLAPYDRLYVRQYYLKENGFLYVLAFSGPDPQNFDEFEQIVASFEFTDEISSNFASE